MARKLLLCLAISMLLVSLLAALAAPAPVLAGGRTVSTPTVTPTPLPPAKVGSNAQLAIGALVLVVIILFGIGLSFWKKK
jgi:hypothetical protein